MPLYEITESTFRPIQQASFQELKVTERGDLQRLLRTQIEVLDEDLYVLTEEFGDWEDSRRRIDLLAIDRDANLVVIELKITNDGGHMELQALRYASMISTMTFDRAVEIHATFLEGLKEDGAQAENRLLDFLGWNEANQESFGNEVRILLVSADFGKELTTAVLWLRNFGIDIRCTRMTAYSDGSRKMIDFEPIIPLPEANEYQIQLRRKEQVEKIHRTEKSNIHYQFWSSFLAEAKQRNFVMKESVPQARAWIRYKISAQGIYLNFIIRDDDSWMELYIEKKNTELNKQTFDQLITSKEKIERDFGKPLIWERRDGKRACRIKHIFAHGGYKNPESEWPMMQAQMIENMIKFESTLTPHLAQLPQGTES